MFGIDIKLMAAIAGIIVLLLGIVSVILKKLGVKIPATAISWQSFLRGQGTILLFFLLLGMALGWLSMKYLGVETSQTADQIRLVEYRQLALSGQPAYEDLNADGYSHATVYAKSNAPQGSTVGVQVIPEQTPQQGQSPALMQGKDSGWSRLDEPLSAKRLVLIIGGSGGPGTQATSADVLVFLSKK